MEGIASALPRGDCAPSQSTVVRDGGAMATCSNDACFAERVVTGERYVTGADGVVYGKIVCTAPSWHSNNNNINGMAHEACWYCGIDANPEDLYKPCPCDSLIHRSCFRKWRTGWINPRNYFSCPTCMYSYNMERVRPSTTDSKERMHRHYRLAVLKVWAALVLGFGAAVALLAGIAYRCDTADKDIPVAMRCLLTSVVGGFPDSNSTTQWRADFQLPTVRVWPYYSLFGLFLTSILVLLLFCYFGATFDESDRSRSGHCNCCDDCCMRGGGGDTIFVVNTGPDHCCSCNACCDCCSGHHHHDNCCDGGCSGGHPNCSGGSNDLGAVLAAIVIAIVAVVIFSAITVLVVSATQKCSLLYDRLTAMLDAQQRELEGETVVLGMGESWRPNDAV